MMYLAIFGKALAIVATVIALTRIHGVRSFSKMSGFDFAITVSIGSILASTVMAPGDTVWIGVAALVSLFAIQFSIAQARARGWVPQHVYDNRALMIMDGRIVLEDNLVKAGMTPADLRAKLREAGVTDLDRIVAVVAESTGDVSVLQGSAKDASEISEMILRDVTRKT